MGTGQWLTSQKYFSEIPQAETIAIEKRVTGEQEKGRYQRGLGKQYKNSETSEQGSSSPYCHN